MADNLSTENRRKNMSHIRSINSKPEEIVRKYLFFQGFRYRKNVRSIPGCPDIVLPKYHTVVFVNGCFWHKHDCPRFVWPASNEEYWHKKILGNVNRDNKNYELLNSQGWNVIVVWECELKKTDAAARLNSLCSEIKMGKQKGEIKMAQISAENTTRIEKHRNTIHEKVQATYTVFEQEGKKYVQLDTYGRVGRKYSDKISQSIQFDKDTAKYIIDIFKKEFNL